MTPPFSSRPSFVSFPADKFAFGAGLLNQSFGDLTENLRIHMAKGEWSGLLSGESVWAEYSHAYSDYFKVFASGSHADARLVVSTLFATALTHGFQQGHIVQSALRSSERSRFHVGAIILDRFIRLAEALGVESTLSPEHGQTAVKIGDLDELLSRIEDHVGCDLTAPSIDGALFGVNLTKGIFTDRHFDGIYGAWRLKSLAHTAGHDHPAVCEIGGGAGYIPYYAHKMGLTNFTIIDLPAAGIVQYLLLGSDLGTKQVKLGYEPGQVSIVRNDSIGAIDFSAFEFVVNVDSFPEMPKVVASDYIRRAALSGSLLSINQESGMLNGTEGQNIVRQLCHTEKMKLIYRFPSWMRNGYVEELFCPS
jgi:hypothetical protein